MEPILHLIPEPCPPERLLTARPELGLPQPRTKPQAGHGIRHDAHRGEWRWPLEDHADPAPDIHRIGARSVDVGAVEDHASGQSRAPDLLVHAVKATDKRRLPAAGRPDDRGNRAVPRHHGQIFQYLVGPEPRTQAGRLYGARVASAGHTRTGNAGDQVASGIERIPLAWVSIHRHCQPHPTARTSDAHLRQQHVRRSQRKPGVLKVNAWLTPAGRRRAARGGRGGCTIPALHTGVYAAFT